MIKNNNKNLMSRIEYKSTIVDLNQNVFDILIGVLLGDAHMRCTGKNPFIEFEQCSKHKDYIFHLLNVFFNYT